MATSDLRNALQYVRRFRDQVFVIGIDGPVIAHDNFDNVLLDVAVLHSLGIRVVIAHGISRQVKDWSEKLDEPVTDLDGTGPVDETTLRLARTAAGQVTSRVLDGLFSTSELRGAVPNAVKAKPAGVLKGVDHLFGGRVDQVDASHLRTLLDHGVIPVVPPIGTDASGQGYRLNSDEVAERIACDLEAVKLIYLTTKPKVEVEGEAIHQISSREMEDLLDTKRDGLDLSIVSKVEASLRACKGGVKRAHIIDGRQDECLVSEVFSNEGVGTMIHVNEYQFIRNAQPRDVSFIWALARTAMEKDEVLRRTRTSIQKQIDDFYVFETDGAVLGCVALHHYPEESKAEVAALHVSPAHTNQGIGTRLVSYVEDLAREQSVESLFCLSTQAFTFFQQELGFEETEEGFLPEARRQKYQDSARNSKILAKRL